MSTRTMGPASGWRWLLNAVNLGGGNPRAVLGGAALMMLVALVPSLIQIVVQSVMGVTSAGVMIALMGFSVLFSLLVMGPLFAGYLRLLHGSETGAPVRAAAIFDVFGGGQGAGRVIGVLLGLIVIGMVLFGAVAFAFGGDFFAQIGSVFEALEGAEPGTTPVLPPLPSGLGTFLGLLFIVGMFFNGAYAIALGQVALGGRGIGEALRDGLLGALRNLLPLLVLSIVVTVGGMLALLLLGLLVAVLMGVGTLVHPALGMVLAAPAYLAAMVALYVVMFGVMYYMWRDVCGGPSGVDSQHEVVA
ncbi:hypothetical protein WCE39_08985 [Luteimonas sp. MJ174]|uniref:hypothetical protein n=1 Tax=Luteimonas sp. MJ174 TaxID=3129237 RepID=UPI0031BA6DD0